MRACNWPKYLVFVNGEIAGQFQLDEWDEFLAFAHRQRVIYGPANVTTKGND